MIQTPAIDRQKAALFARLDVLSQQKPELAEPLAFYRATLPLLNEAQAQVEPVELPAEVARQKLAAGLPLLLGEDLPLAPEATRDLFIRLCGIVETVGLPQQAAPPQKKTWPFFFGPKRRPDPAQLLEQAHAGNETALRTAAAQQIRQAVEQRQLDLLAVWSALATGDGQLVDGQSHDLKLDANLVRTLAQNSLKPALRAWAADLKEKVDLAIWRRGSCPVCGSPPTLAEIQGKEGARHLRCGMCGADWGYPRLKCATCTNQNHKSLGYITVEGEEEKYSIQTCQVCHNYLKVIVTFEPTPVDMLAIEDLATLHLDLIANERGYSH